MNGNFPQHERSEFWIEYKGNRGVELKIGTLRAELVGSQINKLSRRLVLYVVLALPRIDNSVA